MRRAQREPGGDCGVRRARQESGWGRGGMRGGKPSASYAGRLYQKMACFGEILEGKFSIKYLLILSLKGIIVLY